MIKILLDTDIGGDIDDALCLAYLLKEPQCALIGITTVSGQSEKRASVADAICQAAGKDIPITAGMDLPLQPIPVYPTPDGAVALNKWPHKTYKQADAPAFLYQKIIQNPHEIILIGIGNMTNIGLLFQRYKDAPALLKGLYMMNGYFGDKPLPDPCYNWNAWADPLASKIVYETPVAIHKTIPLEVTDSLTLPAAHAAELFKANHPLMKAVFDFSQAWLMSANKLTLHDPLAAVSIFHPSVCTFQKGFVTVETKIKGKMGSTTFTPNLNGFAKIATSVQKDYFYQVLSSTLNS